MILLLTPCVINSLLRLEKLCMEFIGLVWLSGIGCRTEATALTRVDKGPLEVEETVFLE